MSTMTKEEERIVLALRSKVEAIKQMLDRIEDHGGISVESYRSLSWILRTATAVVLASEPSPPRGRPDLTELVNDAKKESAQ
jgi:hypothetical protein